jgi:hypothetical protein
MNKAILWAGMVAVAAATAACGFGEDGLDAEAAIKDGVPGAVLKDEAIRLEAQRTELRARLERAAEPPPLLHPNMADLYREKVTQLARGLQHEESRTEAAEALRGS